MTGGQLFFLAAAFAVFLFLLGLVAFIAGRVADKMDGKPSDHGPFIGWRA